MLVLTRREGQWLKIKHVKSGEILYIRTYKMFYGVMRTAFDDPERNFDIQRTERKPDGKIN